MLLVAWPIAVQFDIVTVHLYTSYMHISFLPMSICSLSLMTPTQEWFMCNLQDSAEVSIFSKAISVRPHSVTFIHARLVLNRRDQRLKKVAGSEVVFYSSDFFWWLFCKNAMNNYKFGRNKQVSLRESHFVSFLGRCTLCTMNGLISRFAHFMRRPFCSLLLFIVSFSPSSTQVRE